MLLLLAACTGADVKLADDTAPDPSGDTGPEVVEGDARDWYDPDHVIEVSITLPAADWDTLRYQVRSVYELLTGDCLAAPFDSPFTWFDAAITIDGVARPDARIRKKGLLGSMSSTRPSLKVDLGDAPIDGREHFTLNGAPQDPTMLRTCLAYEAYAAAGVPAPRCSFAHLTVNGDDLGIYASVEPLDELFLDRAFGGHDGELFEGTLSDFRDGWLGTFDPDTDNADVAHLQPVVDALDGPDAGLYDRLEPLVDMDAFHRFWAAEVLVGQWDGYTSNTNNYYVYLDAEDGRLRFVPWGPDGAFATDEPFGQGAPRWVVANAQLPWRLIQTAEGEERHRAAIEELLDTGWDTAAMDAEIDRMAALVAPYWTIDRQEKNQLASVVADTESGIRASLADDPAVWPDALRSPPCLVEIGTIEATFATTWGSWATENAFAYGDASMTLVWDGSEIPAPDGFCVAGDDGTGYAGILPVLPLGTATIIPYIGLPPTVVTSGSVDIDGVAANATLYYEDDSTGGSFVAAGYIGGSVTFTAGGTTEGDPVEGTLVGTVYVPGG